MTLAEQLQAQMLKNKKVGATKVKENPDLPKKEMTIHEQALAAASGLKKVVKRPPIVDPKSQQQ
jgi:hypothetical protein